MEEKKEFYMTSSIGLGLTIVFSVLVFMDWQYVLLTEGVVLSICFPIVLFVVFVRYLKRNIDINRTQTYVTYKCDNG